MLIADREHAAQQLLTFLRAVGPHEAIWAMGTAQEALQAPDALASGDHVGAVVQAFAEAAAEAEELVSTGVAPVSSKPARGKKADHGDQP
jgi:hypothetical protein